MKSDRNAFIAGLFMLVCFLLAGGVLIGIKGFPGVVAPMQTRQVRFSLHDDISGLRVGDELRLGGLKVGTVQSIAVDTTSPEASILVTIALPQEYVLHPSAVVSVQSTLTGSVCLNIEKLGDGPALADGQVLTGVPSPMSTLLAAFQKAAPDIPEITNTIRMKTLPKVNDVAQKADDAIGQAKDLIHATGPDVQQTLKNIHTITNNINTKLPDLMNKLAATLDSAHNDLDSARGALEDAKQTVANARVISATARSILVDNQSKFNRIIDAVEAASENLKAGMVEIRHSPWRLLYKPGPDEMGNINLYDSARQFADGAQALDDASSALRDALRDPKADPKQIHILMKQLDQAFDNFNQVEQKLWSAVKN